MADTPEAPAATAEPDAPPATTEPAPSQEALGEAGKAALEAERKARKAAEKAARDAQAKLDKLTEDTQTETEKAIEKARREAAEAATAEVTTAFRTQLLHAEIRAQAAGRFANPDLAVKVLDIDADEVFDGDVIQTDRISKAVDDFLEIDENAGLRADGTPVRPMGDVDAGKGSSGPAGTPEQQHNEWLAGILQRP